MLEDDDVGGMLLEQCYVEALGGGSMVHVQQNGKTELSDVEENNRK